MQTELEDGIRTLRQFLDGQNYNAASLTERLGSAWPPAPGEEKKMLEQSSEINAENILVRLFLLGLSIDAQTMAEFIPAPLMKFCLSARLLQLVDDRIQACIVIVPIEDLLFASDAFRVLGTDAAADFVLPASTHAANFLRFATLREPLDTALDLGCGCGIQALFAARHCKRVVATDVSAGAIRYTRFNAILNAIDNVECIEGSLFEPVENQLFDLIISNPPFVVSASDSFVYRDNALELDEFCHLLAKQAPLYLREGGHLQMLCEWVETPSQDWVGRVSSAVRGCDAWVLHAAPVAPEQYVATRTQDIGGDNVDAGAGDDWLNYLQQRKVRFVHPCMLVLRKRTASNWLHVQDFFGDITSPAGDAVARRIGAIDFLESCDDESLLQAMLGTAPELSATAGDVDNELRLTLRDGVSADMRIDGSVAAFLQCFDGELSVEECIGKYAVLADTDAASMNAELLDIVRVFVSRGFLQTLTVEQ